MDVLVLCTGNICRSPVAAALLRERLAALDIGARVSSAGTLEGGHPASEHSVALMAERGIDISGHRSRAVDADMVRNADLVVAMARAHVREAVVRAADRWPRIFTLKELVRRGERVGPRPAGVDLGPWLARAHSGRVARDMLGDSLADDVTDPIGQPRWAYERMVAEIDDLVDRLVMLAWAGDELAPQASPARDWRLA